MITPFDFDVDLMLAMNVDCGSFVDQVMWYISAKFTWVPLYVAVLWWVWRTKGWRFALVFLLAMGLMVLLADQTASLCKQHLSKFRPTHYPPLEGLIHTVNGYRGGLYGTVSSHAANSAGFAVIAAMVIRRGWFTITLSMWVLLVSYSRIYLGVHYPMDIFFGLMEGTIWGLMCYRLLKFTEKRFNISTLKQ